MTSLNYIQAHFLTFEQMAAKSDLSVSDLEEMIAADCLPGPAYQVETEVLVQSVFGPHKELCAQAFYPPSYVAKAKAVAADSALYQEQACVQKANFMRTYRQVLEAERAWEFGLEALFLADKKVGGAEAERFLESEWQHYLDGTYGLCTRNATFEEIAVKEVAIAKIKHFLAVLDRAEDAGLKAELAEAVDRLDSVSSPFAPHERGRSSRGKWIDEVREKYLGMQT